MSARVVVDEKCPTCSGTGRLLNMSIPGGPSKPCPHCTGGVVTWAVTCAKCKNWNHGNARCEVVNMFTPEGFGCNMWEVDQ